MKKVLLITLLILLSAVLLFIIINIKSTKNYLGLNKDNHDSTEYAPVQLNKKN